MKLELFKQPDFYQTTITLVLLTVLSLPAQAREPSKSSFEVDEVIVVTANRTTQNINQVLSSISIIDRQDIERIQAKSIGDLLEQVVGLDLTRQGGGGQQAAVFSRGTDSGHILVVVNGLRIGSATDGATAFSNIPTAQIERIEVIKGPRAALWGSDAIGGVIQIFTRDLAGGELDANLETGSQGFIGATAAAGLQHGDGNTTLSVNSEKSAGFDAFNDATATEADSQPDDDGYDRLSAAINGQQQLSDAINLAWLGKADRGSSEFDSDFGGDQADFDSYLWQLKGRYQFGDWQHTISLGQTDEKSETFGNGVEKSNAEVFETQRNQLNLLSQYQLNKALALALGVDFYKESVSGTTAYENDSRAVKGFFGYLLYQKNGLILQTALRYDDIEGIDAESTYNASVGYRFSPELLVSINAGQGFKAPSYNDLYFPSFGNPELVAETSDSLELLVRAKPFGITAELNLYQTDIDNLIEFNPSISKPENIAEVEIEGAELTLSASHLGFNHKASISYVDATNTTSGERLIRRAKNNYAYQVGYSWQQLDLTLEYEYHGKRSDVVFPAPSFSRTVVWLDNYQLLNLSVGYQLTPEWQLRFKANNLTDQQYNTVAAYNSPGAEYFLSLSYNVQ